MERFFERGAQTQYRGRWTGQSRQVNLLQHNFLSEYIPCGILIAIIDVNQFIVRDCEFKDCFFREMIIGGRYGLFRDSTSGEYMTLKEKFRPNNFTVDDYLKHAEINLERDRLVGGYNVKSDDVKNISVVHSFRF